MKEKMIQFIKNKSFFRWMIRFCGTKSKHIFSNVASGTHEGGNISYEVEVDVSERFLFGSITGNEKVTLSGSGKFEDKKSGDYPMGVITDEGKKGDTVNFQVFGSNNATMKVIAGDAIEAGDAITPDDNSKAVPFEKRPAGNYVTVGFALKSAKAGEYVEFTPISLFQTKS